MREGTVMTHPTRIDEKVLKAALRPSPRCATIEELGTLAEGGTTRDPRVAEHVAGCVRCEAELAMLRDFEAAAPRPEEALAARWITSRLDSDVARLIAAEERSASAAPAPAPVARGQAAPRRWQPRLVTRSALAATLALAAAALLFVNLRGATAPVLSPDAARAPGVFRSRAVTLVAPLDDVDRAPAELRWEPVSGAASYAVTMTEVDRTEVWRAEVKDPQAPLPAPVRARIVPGKPFQWQVEAKDASGAVVASSGMQRFKVPFEAGRGRQ
jgi:hypothetical protein